MSPARRLLSVLVALYRFVRRVACDGVARTVFFGLLALLAAWPLLSTAASLNDFRDAHVLSQYEAVARESLVRWHQAPLWDPYYCGGMYLLGAPQARFVSPTFLLTLVFGENRAESLTAFAMMMVGLEGAFRYMRHRGATRFGAILAAPVFALSGIFAVSPALGWINFFGFELLPWIAFGVRLALAREWRGAVTLALATAWCIGFGGTYPAPLAALWGAFEIGEYLLKARPGLRGAPRTRAQMTLGLGTALVGVALAAALAAVRLWPIVDTMALAPRIVGGAPGNSYAVLAKMFLFPMRPDTDEGEFHVGSLALAAVVAGVTRRRGRPLLVAVVVFGWLAAGYGLRPSLFGILHRLPLYGTLRYPERFLVLVGLAYATLAAQGISFLETYLRSAAARKDPRRGTIARWAMVVTTLMLAGNLVPLVAQHVFHAAGRELVPVPAADDPPRAFHQARGNRWALAYYEPMNRGSLSCWEAYPVPESPLLRGDLADEEYLLDPGAGAVKERRWSPGAIDLDVTLSRPASVAINHNWDPGWRANLGEVRSERGRLTVALPPGQWSLALRFAPRSARGGGIASLVGLAALLALAWRACRTPRVASARDLLIPSAFALVSAVPVVAMAGLEPLKRVEQPLLTEDGRPVVAESVPEGAVGMNARFSDGVTLEAATLSPQDPRAGTEAMLELDWRRGAELEPGLGIFVHIEPSSGKNLNGDHVLLSNVLDLEHAPADATLRDVMPLYVPDDGRGKTWKVWVGLWRVRLGGDRVPVSSPGYATVDGERVLAASFVPK